MIIDHTQTHKEAKTKRSGKEKNPKEEKSIHGKSPKLPKGTVLAGTESDSGDSDDQVMGAISGTLTGKIFAAPIERMYTIILFTFSEYKTAMFAARIEFMYSSIFYFLENCLYIITVKDHFS